MAREKVGGGYAAGHGKETDVRELAGGHELTWRFASSKERLSGHGRSLYMGNLPNVTGRVWKLGACDARAWETGLRGLDRGGLGRREQACLELC